MNFMGLDAGTSGCKAVVFDESGVAIAQSSRSYPLRHPKPGWAELDAMEVWTAARESIREAAARSGQPVGGIGICCQGEAFVAMDRENRVLGPAMVSSDTRAAGEVAELVRSLGVQFFYERTGHTPHPLFTLFKIRWLRENHPELWNTCTRFLCMEEFLQVMLGLEPAIPFPLAGRTMLFHPERAMWVPELLDLAGLCEEQLAKPVPSGTIVGRIKTSLARELGLAAECDVVTGGHDQVVAALGAGACSPGQALYAMGSVECIVVVSDSCRLEPALRDGNLCTYPHALPGCFAHLAYSLTGANLVSWLKNLLLPNHEEAYEILFAEMPGEPTDLLCLPHFTASGTPFFDVNARGAFAGLSFRHSRGDLFQSAIEGLAFEMKTNLELLSSADIRVASFLATGGGTKSRRSLQIKADVLGIPIVPTKNNEGGCLGAAILANSALTATPLDAFASWFNSGDPVIPNTERHEKYRERFSKFQKLYPSLQFLNAPNAPPPATGNPEK